MSAPLIALVGGKQVEREDIARRLVASGMAPLSAFALREPCARYPHQRAGLLRAAVAGLGGAEGLVITHCLTEREAKTVRELGGTVWHLYSRPSAMVVIRNGDQIVTSDPRGLGHIRAPLEALAQQLERRA